jgi:hypothetical protein
MAKHPKRPRDTNQLAKLMVDILTGQVEDREPTPEEQGKNPAAVALGKLGAAKGGRARASRLAPEQRIEAAKTAIRARWAKRGVTEQSPGAASAGRSVATTGRKPRAKLLIPED